MGANKSNMCITTKATHFVPDSEWQKSRRSWLSRNVQSSSLRAGSSHVCLIQYWMPKGWHGSTSINNVLIEKKNIWKNKWKPRHTQINISLKIKCHKLFADYRHGRNSEDRATWSWDRGVLTAEMRFPRDIKPSTMLFLENKEQCR